jgi:hypothetical protein
MANQDFAETSAPDYARAADGAAAKVLESSRESLPGREIEDLSLVGRFRISASVVQARHQLRKAVPDAPGVIDLMVPSHPEAFLIGHGSADVMCDPMTFFGSEAHQRRQLPAHLDTPGPSWPASLRRRIVGIATAGRQHVSQVGGQERVRPSCGPGSAGRPPGHGADLKVARQL